MDPVHLCVALRKIKQCTEYSIYDRTGNVYGRSSFTPVTYIWENSQIVPSHKDMLARTSIPVKNDKDQRRIYEKGGGCSSNLEQMRTVVSEREARRCECKFWLS